jgi:hypothetical protein
MTAIILSDLPETIQTSIELAQTTGENLTITKNGIPLAIISPIKKSPRAAFGAMKDSVKIVGDILEPTSNLVDWDVLA